MWDTKEEFISGAQFVAERLLGRLAHGLNPKVFFLGVSENSSSSFMKVWIEPRRNNCLNINDFKIAKSTIERIRKRIRLSQIRIYRASGEKIENDNRKQLQAIQRLVLRAVSRKMRGGSRQLFASLPFERNGEFILSLVVVDSAAAKLVPSIKPKIFRRNGFSLQLPRSLVEASINEFLERSISAIRDSEKEPILDIRGSIGDIIQSAGRRMFSSAVLHADAESLFLGRSMTLYDTMERLSLAPYERNEADGTLLISSKFEKLTRSHLNFGKQVAFREKRLIRKLLEVAGDDYAIGCTCKGVTSIWRTRSPNLKNGEHIAAIEFSRRGNWILAFDGNAIMSVVDGVPQLPKVSAVSEDLISDLAKHFNKKNSLNIGCFSKILVSLETAGHGSLIVISSRAASEAKRLSADAITIEPTFITAALAVNLSKVDGAILCSPDGLCFAFGVILDGLRVGAGDRGRGSRFNSAKRYIASMQRNAAAIVFSEDGGLDVLPRPRD